MKKVIDDMSENEIKGISLAQRKKKSSEEEKMSSEASPMSGHLFDKNFRNPILTPDPGQLIQESLNKQGLKNAKIDPNMKGNQKGELMSKLIKVQTKMNDSRDA